MPRAGPTVRFQRSTQTGPQRRCQFASTVVRRISTRRASSAADTGTTTMAPLAPFTQVGRPVLQARPSVVSRSASAQMAASSRGTSRCSRVRRSAGSEFHTSRLAPKIDRPQVSGMG